MLIGIVGLLKGIGAYEAFQGENSLCISSPSWIMKNQPRLDLEGEIELERILGGNVCKWIVCIELVASCPLLHDIFGHSSVSELCQDVVLMRLLPKCNGYYTYCCGF